MQVTGDGLMTVCRSTLANEGVGSFWKGIVWAWGREGSYASIKLGAYAPVRDAMGASGKDAPFYLKFAAGAITGGVGSIIGNPFDVLKTLAQANKGKSVPLMTLVGNMYSEQGIAGFYRGVTAKYVFATVWACKAFSASSFSHSCICLTSILRACVLNATKMGVYDISKGYVTEATGWSRKDIKTSFCSATLAGFFMTVRSGGL